METTNIYKISSNGLNLCPIDDEMLHRRRIFFAEEVNSATMNSLLKKLMYLELTAPGQEITLYINSPGGECVSGLAVIDYIAAMKSPIRTVCIGTAASIGAVLFLTVKRREMLRHTQLMIHDPSAGGSLQGMKPHEIEAYLKMLTAMQHKLIGIIAAVSGRSEEEIAEVTRSDTYFDLEEALSFGLATAEFTGE